MRRMRKFFENKTMAAQFLLIVLAVMIGGVGMAAGATIGAEGPDPVGKEDLHDPADPEAGTGQRPDAGGNQDARLAPGDTTAGQNLDGTQASSTQARQGGLEDEEWDSEVTKFQPFRNPLLALARQVTRKVNISNWTVSHGRVGGETLDGRTKVKITAETDGSIKLTTTNFRGSLKPFYKCSTLLVPSVAGYSKSSTSTNLVKEGGLMLYVVENTGTAVTCRAVNGIPTDDVIQDDLDSKKCPEIPADTYICAASTAMSESQLLLTPENYQPRKEVFYVQKKGFNIVFTDDYEKTKKKQPLKVADLKADSVYKYNMRANRTYWAGVQGKFQVRNQDGSMEDVFTTKGILWQLTNSYEYEKGKLTLADLVAISKLQFTTFSQTDSAYVFCGKDAMEELLNLQMTGTTRIINFEDVKDMELDFKRFKSTYGTLNFIWDQGLDSLGYKDAMVVVDLKGATRYVKMGQKDQTNDMSKGAGEIREAKRYIRTEADGIALRGYNSIIVLPTGRASGLPESQMRSKVISSPVLPAKEATTDKMIVALTADYKDTYKKGHAYQATVSSGTVTWNEYTGYTSVIM